MNPQEQVVFTVYSLLKNRTDLNPKEWHWVIDEDLIGYIFHEVDGRKVDFRPTNGEVLIFWDCEPYWDVILCNVERTCKNQSDFDFLYQ